MGVRIMNLDFEKVILIVLSLVLPLTVSFIILSSKKIKYPFFYSVIAEIILATLFVPWVIEALI